MAGFQDQQAIQQLLAGMNTMQMQAGLMPGGLPVNSQPQSFTPPRVPTPAEFSNNLEVNYARRFNPVTTMPPMFGGVSPVPRNDYAMSILPPTMLSGGWGAARQQALGHGNRVLSGFHMAAGIGGGFAGAAAGSSAGAAAGAGIGAFFGGIGAVPGAAIGGVLGGIAGGFGGSYLGEALFNPFIAQRERALQLQNSSLMHVRTGSDLSASGLGLSSHAAMGLERNLMNIADGRQFKRDTQNMFNRQDMMKMTNISAQVGLLDSTQSVDQISKEMGKIGRALSVFMKVVEEPDVQEALKMMGKMRTLGMSIPETNMAAANARTFARMAGTTVQGVMAQGMQGAGLFQQYGMTGATGFNAGMAGAGMAGILATGMDPRQLALQGGAGGMAQTLTSAAAKASQFDAILPGLAKMDKSGHLVIDQKSVLDFAKGNRNANELVQHSAQRLSAMGPKGFMEAYQRDRGDLQDQLMRSLGGRGSVLAPMLLAKSVVETGAADTLAGGLAVLHFDENEIRTLDTAFRQPNFFKNLRDAGNPDSFMAQSRRKLSRAEQERRAGSEGWDRLLAPFDWSRTRNRLGRSFDAKFQKKFGSSADIEEMQAAAGGGDILQAVHAKAFSSEEQLTQLREELASDRAGAVSGAAGMAYLGEKKILRREKLDAAEYERTRIPFLSSMFAGQRGPEGFGLGPKSEYITETINRSQGFNQRMGRVMGLTPEWARTVKGIEKKSTELTQFGAEIERGIADENKPKKFSEFMKRMEAAGIPRETAVKMLGRASAGAEEYLESTHLMGINMDSVSQGTMTSYMRTRAGQGVSKQQLAAFMNDEGLRELVIAQGTGGRTEASSAALNKIVSGGADLTESKRLKTIDAIRRIGNISRKGLLGRLGITGNMAGEEEKAKLVDIFGATSTKKGDDADLRKKAVAIKAINAAMKRAKRDGGSANDKKVEHMSERISQLTNEMSLLAGENAEGEQRIEDAHAYAAGATSTLSEETQEYVGTMLGRGSAEDLNKNLDAMGQLSTRIRGSDLNEGLASKLGDEGFNLYREAQQKPGATSESARRALANYVKGGGKLGKDVTDEERAALEAGTMSDEDIDRMGGKAAQNKALMGAAGGSTSLSEPKTDIEKNADETVKTLEDWSGKMLDRANTSFNKLDTAADKLLKVAGGGAATLEDLSEAGTRLMRNLKNTVHQTNGPVREGSENQ